jgi:hypothetical protein
VADKINERFLKAVAPEPYTILGLRLKPFSLGHAILLQRHGCDPVRDYESLVTGVTICAHTWKEFHTLADDKWLPWRMRIWAWRVGAFNILEKIKFFNDYVGEAMESPDVFECNDKPANRLGAPFFSVLKTTLCAKLGYSRDEALNLPFGEGLFDYFSFWEIEGGCELVGDHDLEMKKLAEDMETDLDALAKRHFPQFAGSKPERN